MTRLLCDVYRSPRREEMYLYVDRAQGLEPVPDGLLNEFGRPETALTLILTPGRRLARVDVNRVVEAIERQGYYLQMPPTGSALERDRAFDIDAGRP